ncbi:MAG: hypothetical protein RI980_1165 [Bacteroidota bacterium]|jgi:hypothetical protein
MKKKIIHSTLLLFLSLTMFAQTQEKLGEEFIKAFLVEKNHVIAYDYFDVTIKEKMTLYAFEQAQSSIEEQFGKFVEIIEVNNEGNTYYYYSKLENSTTDFKIRFNSENKIVGFIFTPHKEFDKKKVNPKN